MNSELVLAAPTTESRAGEALALTPAHASLRKMVLDPAPSPHTRRHYAKALDNLFAFCASRLLSRSLLMEWRGRGEALAPPTINIPPSGGRQPGGGGPRAGLLRAAEEGRPTRQPTHQPKGSP